MKAAERWISQIEGGEGGWGGETEGGGGERKR